VDNTRRSRDTKALARIRPILSKNDGRPNDKIGRDVGEPDAMGRHMTSHAAATRAVTRNGTDLQRGRASLVALWLTQVALAVMFLMAGGSKLSGVPAMVSLFDAIGLGQWFRYGALLLIPTMLGAIIVNLFVVPASPVVPLVLLVATAAVAWTRRHQLRMF
jgi:putative oxidoreductase